MPGAADRAAVSPRSAEATVELSIVATLYNSAPYLEKFYRRVCAASEQVVSDFEIVLVNDGSPDHSLEIAVELYERDPRVRVIDLSRNFGHHKAMMTGLRSARGRLVFLIDCDLEVEPEVLPAFFEQLRTSGADVVYGVQATRQDRLLDRLAGSLFYVLFNWLSTDPLPPNLLTTRLMTRRYVAALGSFDEREILIGGLWVITGFAQVPFEVHKGWKGKTSYNLRRKLRLLTDGIVSFSEKPLILIFYLGLLTSAAAALGILYLVVRWAFFGGFLIGWASVIVTVGFLGGLNLFCLGIIGLYLSKVFVETKRRPFVIIRDVYQRDGVDRSCGPMPS